MNKMYRWRLDDGEWKELTISSETHAHLFSAAVQIAGGEIEEVTEEEPKWVYRLNVVAVDKDGKKWNEYKGGSICEDEFSEYKIGVPPGIVSFEAKYEKLKKKEGSSG